MKKDILFIDQYFYPGNNSSATLPSDTAFHLAGAGFSVDTLCGYHREYITEQNVPREEDVNGVHIRRLAYLQLRRRARLSRMINYISFTAAVLRQLPRLKNYRCLAVYTNPPTLPLSALLANRLYGVPFVFVSFDVYPEVAFASRSLRENGIVSRTVQRMNRRLFQRASAVVALTEEMKQYLLSVRPTLSEERVEVIPNWAHEESGSIKPETYEKYGFRPEQFIVGYFGNLGICQDVETLLEAMRLLQDDSGIAFLIAGHGGKKKEFDRRCAGMERVVSLDYLVGSELEDALAICSCGIVSLEKGLAGTCAPSKVYSYMQSGLPTLAIVDEGSYLDRMACEEKIGLSIRQGDAAGLAEAIRRLAEDPGRCRSMGAKARKLYETQYSRPVAMGRYEALFRRVIRQSGDAGGNEE